MTEPLELSWKQKAVVFAPVTIGFLAGIISTIAGVSLLGKQVELLPFAIIFVGVGCFCTVLGGRITSEWKENLEESNEVKW